VRASQQISVGASAGSARGARTTRRRRGATTFHATVSAPLFALGLAGAAAPAVQGQSVFEEVVVTSSRAPTPLRETGTSLSVLVQEEIEQRGFLSLPDILRTQPSVAASNTGGLGKATTLRIRGEEGYRTMVLLDGVDIADTSSPQVSPRLEQLLTTGIERVEILRGPQGLHYGADAGGVINIRTLTPDSRLSGRLSLEGGRFGTQQVTGSLGRDLGAVDFSLMAAHLETDGFNARDLDATAPDRDGYENDTFHGRAGWDVTDTLRIEAVARHVAGDNAFDSCFTRAFTPTNACRDTFDQSIGRLSARLVTGKVNHNLAYSESRSDREFFADGAPFFRAQGSLERLSYVGHWRPSEAIGLVYGADLENEAIDDGTFERDRDQVGAFAEIQGRPTRALTLTAGGRWDDNDDFGAFNSYRISAAHVTGFRSGELKVKGTLGTGFRAPSLYEISYNSGPFAQPPAATQSLREERSRGYDLGVAWAWTAGPWAEIIWFDQEVEDLITFDLQAFSGYVQAPGDSRSSGVEFIAHLPLPAGFEVQGNFTWNETEMPDGSQRPFRPEQLLNLGVSHTSADARLRVAANLRSAADAIDTTGEALDDYTLVDLNVSYRLLAELLVYARLENALDEAYQEVPTYNTAGSAAYAGVRYEF